MYSLSVDVKGRALLMWQTNFVKKGLTNNLLKELLWEKEGREELSWEEIKMQLACESLRLLGKASLCLVAEIMMALLTWWPGKGLRPQKCACIDGWFWLHPPLFIIWHCLVSALSQSINLFVFYVLVAFMESVMQQFVWAPVSAYTCFETQQKHRWTLGCINLLGNWCLCLLIFHFSPRVSDVASAGNQQLGMAVFCSLLSTF